MNNKSHEELTEKGYFPWQFVLLCVAGLGVAVLLGTLNIAYGISAVLFGGLACVFVIAFMVKRYRLKLRTLMLVMTLLCVWLGIKANRDARLNRALSQITNSGGRFEIHDKQGNFPWGLWKHRYRIDYYGLKQPIPQGGFQAYEALAPSSVQWLNLSNTGITDSDLKSIEQLTNLEFLSLANETYFSGEVIPDRPQNSISDAGLARLDKLKNLKGIDLRGTKVTDKGLKVLSTMPGLIWVHLDGTEVTGSGIKHLGSQGQFMMLELNGCKLDPTAYQTIIQIPNLHSLGLRNTGCTDEDLQLLQQNLKLGILRLNDTEVSEEAVDQFKRMHPKCTVEY